MTPISKGALVTWAHWPYPAIEAPLDIAMRRIDSIDILTTDNPFEHHPELVDVYKMHGPVRRLFAMRATGTAAVAGRSRRTVGG
jgi:hypothetical protein